MERSVEVLAIVFFGVIGLSHLLQPKAWVKFFILLRGKGEAGVFVDGFLTLQMAGIIIGFHNVWSGLPMVLTIVGWAYILKALLCFLVPQTQVRTLGRVSPERAPEFIVPGILFVAMAGLLLYILWRQ